MKIRVADRLLVALAGLVLIALSAALVAQMFFAVPLTDWVAQALSVRATSSLVLLGAVAAVLLFVGVYCLCMLFRHGKGKRGFVLQKTENGELSISIRAMESLVQKCVDKHDELHVIGTALETTRDGLIVKLRIGLAGGVSIPLAVSALQKQIKQYITACSGVDVKEVRVQVETAAAKVKDSPYAVPEMLQNPPALPREDAARAPETVASPVDASPASVPPVPVMPASDEPCAKDDRPLHQRLFGREEQPTIVPAPPAQTAEAEEQDAEAQRSADVAAEEETTPDMTDAIVPDEEEKHEIAQ